MESIQYLNLKYFDFFSLLNNIYGQTYHFIKFQGDSDGQVVDHPASLKIMVRLYGMWSLLHTL